MSVTLDCFKMDSRKSQHININQGDDGQGSLLSLVNYVVTSQQRISAFTLNKSVLVLQPPNFLYFPSSFGDNDVHVAGFIEPQSNIRSYL